MKEDEVLKDIPVVVLTTSAASEDILQTYRLHANAFVTKPVQFNDFLRAVHGIEEFWLEIVRLPNFIA
jgi:CheY-like chemotaxis protein